MDLTTLARLQFGATACFHILFPSLLIGLGLYLTWLEAAWLRSAKISYLVEYEFWLRLFGAAFLVAVITGAVLSFQLDGVFSGLYARSGSVLLPLRHAEFLNAVLLEAGCIGVMLFGRARVGGRLHFLATVTVTAGLIFSSVCIIMRNAWMQTPAGIEVHAGQIVLTSRWDMLLNASFPYRYVHVILGGCLSTACVVAGIAAWYLLRRTHRLFATRTLQRAMWTIGLLGPLQIIAGDLHGLNTLQHQPMKIAAIEALWDTMTEAPLVLFAIPRSDREANSSSIEIPGLASVLLTHAYHGKLAGLKTVAAPDRPNVALVFFSFRLMVGCAVAMLLMPLSWWCRIGVRGRVGKPWLLRLYVAGAPLGLIATVAGWCVAEAGRQPWAIYGVVRTADVIDPQWYIHGGSHGALAIGVAYALLLLLYLLHFGHVLRGGPKSVPAA